LGDLPLAIGVVEGVVNELRRDTEARGLVRPKLRVALAFF
jgi:hypothetical protein